MPSVMPAKKFPFEDRDAILMLEQRYWQLSSPAERKREEQLARLMVKARRDRVLSKGLFLVVVRWKSRRPTRHYRKNTGADVRAAMRAAFAAASEADAVHALTALHGVGLRTATALLHWMRPNEFPILDFRIVDALGTSEPHLWDSVDFYLIVAVAVRELAARHGLNLRQVDRALWAWQKLESRKASATRP